MGTVLKRNVLHFQLVQMDSLGLTATRCASARMLLAVTTCWARVAACRAGWGRAVSSVRTPRSQTPKPPWDCPARLHF